MSDKNIFDVVQIDGKWQLTPEDYPGVSTTVNFNVATPQSHFDNFGGDLDFLKGLYVSNQAPEVIAAAAEAAASTKVSVSAESKAEAKPKKAKKK